MAIYITTSDPELLKGKIDKAIDNREIVTWIRDADGDYTINREQWKYKAWLKPAVQDNRLCFGIVKSKNFNLTTELYGVYHGRFISTLLAHFDDDIEDIRVTSGLVKEIDIW